MQMMIEICDTSVSAKQNSTVKKHKTVEVVRASDHPLDASCVRVSWTCPSGKRPLDILRFGWLGNTLEFPQKSCRK